MSKEHETLLVVRGHVTKDIQGASDVVDNTTLDSAIAIANQFPPVDVLVENRVVTEATAEEHCEDKRRTIYVGGTALLWYKLRNVLTFNLTKKAATFRLKKPFSHTLKINMGSGIDAFMVYENRDLEGAHVTVLFGLSARATKEAVKYYIQLSQENHKPDERLIIAKRIYGDVSAQRSEALFMFDKSNW